MATVATFTDFWHGQWALVATAILTIAAVWLVPLAIPVHGPLHKIPIAGLEVGSEAKRRQAYMREAKRIYTEGHQKVSTLPRHSVHIYLGLSQNWHFGDWNI